MRRLLIWLIWLWAGGLTLAWVGAAFDFPDEVIIGFGVPAVMFLGVGALLTTRVRGNRIGPVLLVGASAWLISDVGTAYASASLERGPFPLDYLAAWLGAWMGPISFLMVPVLLVIFPDGRLTGRRRWFLPFFVLVAVSISWGAIAIWGLPPFALADDQIMSAQPSYGPIDVAYPASWLLCLPAGLSLILRFRRSSAIERKQTQWFLACVLAAPIVGFVGMQLLPEAADDLVLATAISLLPVGIGVAVTRYRLYDLDRIVSRSVSYALVVALLTGAVALLATLVGAQFESPLVVAATTLAVVAVFSPLRRRVQSVVDRRFNRSHYDVERVMDDFARSLRDEVDPAHVLGGWVRIVSETMEPKVVGVWVKP